MSVVRSVESLCSYYVAYVGSGSSAVSVSCGVSAVRCALLVIVGSVVSSPSAYFHVAPAYVRAVMSVDSSRAGVGTVTVRSSVLLCVGEVSGVMCASVAVLSAVTVSSVKEVVAASLVSAGASVSSIW